MIPPGLSLEISLEPLQDICWSFRTSQWYRNPGFLWRHWRLIPRHTTRFATLQLIPPGFSWRGNDSSWILLQTPWRLRWAVATNDIHVTWMYVHLRYIHWYRPGFHSRHSGNAPRRAEHPEIRTIGSLHPMIPPGFCWRHLETCWRCPVTYHEVHWHPMIPAGFRWRHLETCWRCPETYREVRDIQWDLLDSAGDTWRPAGDIQRHTTMFLTSNDTSWILLETPGDSLQPSQDICRCSLHLMIPPGFAETPGDLLETSRDIPRGSRHPISPGLCWRHWETCWRCPETYHQLCDVQWYLLDSAGDTWRLAGAFARHMSMFATSNDTSWSLLQAPGDLLETSSDIPQGSRHPMIPPGFCWRHLETWWRCPETYHEVRDMQWYLLDSAADTWRLAGAFARHMVMFATSNDTSWSLLQAPADLLETSRDVPQSSRHPMIPPGFCWRHLETCWRCPETYLEVCHIQWYLLDSAADTWRLARAFARHMLTFTTSNDTSGFCWRHLETCWRHPEMDHKVHDIQWYLLDSAGDTWRPAGDIQRHTTRYTCW